MYICMKALVLDLGDRVISLVLGRDAAGIVPHDAPYNIWPLLKKEVILPLVYCPLRSCCGIEYFFKPTIHGIVFSKKCSRDLTQDRRVTWSDIMAIHSHAIGMWSRLTGGKSLSHIAYRLSRPSVTRIIACGSPSVLGHPGPPGCLQKVPDPLGAP